jgi:hypothetical protein
MIMLKMILFYILLKENFSGVKKIKINQFIQDIDKALDSMKMF